MLRAVANQSAYVGSFTYATLPAAASFSGYEAFASDWGANGTRVRSNGTRWLPVGGRVLLKHLGAAVSGVGSTATIVLQTPAMPLGSVQTNDQILFDIPGLTKSGTTDSLTANMYVGTAGTTADTSLLSAGNVITAAGLTGAGIYPFKVAGNTSVQRVGPAASNGVLAAVSTNAAPAATTVTDMSANALIWSLAILSSGATNTVTIQDGEIWQIVN